VNWAYGSPAGDEVLVEVANCSPGCGWTYLGDDYSSPYDHSGLPPGTTRCYRARAYEDSNGLYSGYSNVACGTTSAAPPGAPTLVSVVAVNSTTLRVNWAYGSPTGTEVHIEHALPYDPWLFLVADSASPFDHGGLQPNSTHCYRLIAHDHTSGALSGYSNWSCVGTPSSEVGTPTLISVDAVNSTTLRVNWAYGSPTGTEVHIEHALPYDPWLFLVADSASPFDHGGLQPNSTHCYRLVAHDHGSGALSAYSGWACVSTPP